MNTDTILKEILMNEDLKNRYWPNVENLENLNLNTIKNVDNLFIKYLSSILQDFPSDQLRKNAISKLIN